MSVDVENLSDEAYYKLFNTELNDAIAPRNWVLSVAKDCPWRTIVKTPGWNYMINARRWSQPEISPVNSAKSRVILRGIITEILTKKRS